MTLGSLIKNQYVLMIGVTVFMLFFAKKMPNMGNKYSFHKFKLNKKQRSCNSKCKKKTRSQSNRPKINNLKKFHKFVKNKQKKNFFLIDSFLVLMHEKNNDYLFLMGLPSRIISCNIFYKSIVFWHPS